MCPSVGILTKQHASQTGQLGMEVFLGFSRGIGTNLFVTDADRMPENLAAILSFVSISLKRHLVKY